MSEPCVFIPSIYTSEEKNVSVNISSQQKVPENIHEYINSYIEKLIKPRFEIFEHEDIKPNILNLIRKLQDTVDNCVKKTGDIISGPLQLLKSPEVKMDIVNKEYTDWLFTTLLEKIELKFSKNTDMDLNHYKIKNVQTPTDLNDAVTKNYVDKKIEELGVYTPQSLHYIFSKGQVLSSSNSQRFNKTFFFNPGFICPQKIHIVSVGFSTSPYKYKIGEKVKIGTINPTKLYFMVNNEIKSEQPIEKDVQLGHTLKEFDEPVIFEKGDNFMMVVESILDDASVNIAFY